ncbi:DUF402 domain-containing protein [Haloarchaeobius amylolyticus]|uniref:DUF402 domain-containing protein n=1 Tax=Haloarchaeobius amylolyticus TaxID=1198296 RepID=UPI0022700396|nr:DUF402 domain-containing protein [Haloarchaeobius amylolyticus]
MSVRVRGIYTTALTQLLLSEGFDVVQASPPIRRRFEDHEADLSAKPAAVEVATTDDRQGVSLIGERETLESVREIVTGVGVDALDWDGAAPRGAVFDGVVSETLGSGAVVDLGDAEGFLPFRKVEGYVDDGDVVRVQVDEPAAPWSDDRALLGTDITVHDGLVELSQGRSGVSANVDGERATEIVRTTEILPVEVPDGWGVRWQRAAADADMSVLADALQAAVDRAADLEDQLADAGGDPDDAPNRLAPGEGTAWVWFGRECRFGLDEIRRDVERTMVGHHRIKAAHRAASTAVDFVEAVCDDPGGEFPFQAVTEQFGPQRGDRIALAHGKPEGRLIVLGRGEITDYDPAGQVTLERQMSGGGSYDALGVAREQGDVAITKLKEGRWWYPTVYRGEDGTKKGTYVNICTPVELFPEAARYVDLHVDVVKHADGTVERVDDDELDEAVAAGHVPAALAEKARSVAAAVERALE